MCPQQQIPTTATELQQLLGAKRVSVTTSAKRVKVLAYFNSKPGVVSDFGATEPLAFAAVIAKFNAQHLRA